MKADKPLADTENYLELIAIKHVVFAQKCPKKFNRTKQRSLGKKRFSNMSEFNKLWRQHQKPRHKKY